MENRVPKVGEVYRRDYDDKIITVNFVDHEAEEVCIFEKGFGLRIDMLENFNSYELIKTHQLED